MVYFSIHGESKINNGKTILETTDVKVRVIELLADKKTNWHYHTEVTDNCFCLKGRIEVHIKDPKQIIILNPGDQYAIQTGEIHRVANNTKEEAKYLLVQGIGKYDYNEIK